MHAAAPPECLSGSQLPPRVPRLPRGREIVAVEDPDFGQVAWIIADRHGIADITRHGRMLIAQSLELDAVALHGSRLRVHDEQEIELFQALGQPRQKPLATPCVERCFIGLAVDTEMISAGYVSRNCRDPTRRETIWAQRSACPSPDVRVILAEVRYSAFRTGAQSCRAPAVGRRQNRRCGIETGRYLIEVLAGEVASVIDVEHVGDTADGPSRIAFPPDCLPQRKASVEYRRSAEKYHDARDSAGMIVHDGCQPRTGRLAGLSRIRRSSMVWSVCQIALALRRGDGVSVHSGCERPMLLHAPRSPLRGQDRRELHRPCCRKEWPSLASSAILLTRR